ncbi:hypothetical protein C8A00DRAFT_41378 [Chaetomidium leptoderma]|uniref:Polyketide synthase n=1 Tax=Chaetomidium leptoderma TaxID=669021 RepID=A0AAN6VRR8_9PEZI|nr:hypothetical protein C8A00DRAFT_41378 [Chaetomidium leptoderma]
MTNKTQTPIAVIGLACRLPGNCNSPEQFWQLLLDGRVADTTPPDSRFSLKGHYDGSLRPWTMRSPGGMFIDADPKNIDAGFFGLSQVDAISMDPQQRQLLEVVYEGLENSGLTLESIKSTLFGCFVGSYASDYSDIQTRDPEDRTPSFTVGSGRAMLSNRISHFLNIRGPSLIAVDLACRYLESGDAEGAIVAGCNLYMSPEHNMDQHAMTSAASPSGRCWTFDARADGYIKAEAINCLILKRLDDAVRHGDPIRAVIRGTSTNSDGWTPGIASPSPEAQAAAIRRAYARAGIANFGDTAYLECHGTGTLAGDPIECSAAASVFSASRSDEFPLRIGSVKSNIGHSEPAAGISGMLKAVLAVERAIIPGNPTFGIPNPKINFEAYKLLASKASTPWPRGMMRRASVNSFGYGGSNAHAIVEHPAILVSGFEATSVTSYATESSTYDMFGADEDEVDTTRGLLVFSANDETSLRAHVKEYIRHLANPAVKVQSADLAYTLAQRRTRHFFRAYAVSDGAQFKESQVVYGKLASSTPRVGFVFTGQGAQWPRMGRDLLEKFPLARQTIQLLDQTLQTMADPPSWRLESELCEPRSPEHMRLPEFSQPLVTALQLALLAVLRDWGLEPAAVVGHSSGEIAAAVAAGCMSQEVGIKVAYLRGKAAKDMQKLHHQGVRLGMLAVGLGPEDVRRYYLESFPAVKIACRNSPKSVTLAGQVAHLEAVESAIKADGHFSRLLMVDLAYHSEYMKDIGEQYANLLAIHCPDLSSDTTIQQSGDVAFFSTVDGALRTKGTGAEYWVRNMLSPVLFDQGVTALLGEGRVDHLVELGPSAALAGPIKQIMQGLSAPVPYSPTFDRSIDATRPLYDLAGKMFFSGLDVSLVKVNGLDAVGATKPRILIDLPNYQWNHSIKYWHESLASKDWRYRLFPVHDLLGTKVLGTSWSAPSWRRTLRLKDVSWIGDHMIGTDVVFPGAAYIAMAIEAVFQMAKGSGMEFAVNIDSVSQASYRLRNVRLLRALVIEEDVQHQLYLFLQPTQGQKDTWFQFKISTLRDDAWTEHCNGLVRIGLETTSSRADTCHLDALQHPSPARLWYKSMQNVGFNFGPAFQNLAEIESVAGQRTSRARINFASRNAQQANESRYPVHPAIFDAFFQAGIPSLFQGHRTLIDKALVPQVIDEIMVSPGESILTSALAVTKSSFTTGRPDKTQNYTSDVLVCDETTGRILAKVQGLHYTELDVPETGKASDHDMTPLRVSWKPDISLLPDDAELDALAASDDEALVLSAGLHLPPTAAFLMSLLHHKVALPSVLDLDTTVDSPRDVEASASEAEADTVALRDHLSAFRRYVYASAPSSTHTVEAQKRLSAISGLEFHVYDPTTTSGEPPFDTKTNFDLVILRMRPLNDTSELLAALRNTREMCSPDGHVVLITPSSSLPDAELKPLVRSMGLRMRAKSSHTTPNSVYHLTPLASQEEKPTPSLNLDFPIIQLSPANQQSTECSTLLASLRSLGWTGPSTTLSDNSNHPPSSFSSPSPTPPGGGGGVLLLLDNPQTPLLANLTDESDWAHLRRLLRRAISSSSADGGQQQLLWLTPSESSSSSSGDDGMSSPSGGALIQGFARSLRSEDPTLRLATLDLSSSLSLSSSSSSLERRGGGDGGRYAAQSTLALLAALNKSHQHQEAASDGMVVVGGENEFWERGDGVLCVSRVVPDETLVRAAAGVGELREGALRGNPRTVRAYCERVGAMDSIHFNEVVAGEEAVLGEGGVEVEIWAAGLNFKDITTCLGIVPENEHLLGLEGAGVIRRVGGKVGSYSVGDRVLVHGKGAFANRICVPKENVFLLPEWLSFEDAATMSIVYFTAVYSLMELSQVRKGQSVLIHSAAGGVGLATIQKRRFLVDEHGIPPERIFSSRTTEFAAGIRALTNGRGVDFVLNFLTGDLLDESWRLLADNGTFLEIGKRDIIDRNSLSMEPFNRNCSYRGIDISRPSILNDLPLIERVLQKVRQMLVAGHIKPISPVKVFPFTQIRDAMRYMRSGEHMGKIVLSTGDLEDIRIPIRQAPQSLTFDPRATYLIVGGLKGLCGSLAVYMARCGARNLSIMSRSGGDDERSRRVLRDLESLGATARIVHGDVSSLEDTKRVFQESVLPIKGVIHGAMLLRDKTFEAMTLQEFQDALASKFAGTRNLHAAAAEQVAGARKLDFFTMLSSISGVVGTAGQANYAAGNSFQDAFARYRHSLGLAAHTVDLGIVDDVGYMSEHQALTDRVRSRSQLSGISESQLHDLLKWSILQQTAGLSRESASQMVTGLPFPLPEDSPLLADKRFHSLLVPQQSRVATRFEGIDAVHAFQMLRKASPSLPAEGLVAEAVKLVNQQMVRVLGLSADMEPSKPLSSYGIDSLAAVDVRNWFKVRLGVELTTLDVLNAPSLEALCAKVVERLPAS